MQEFYSGKNPNDPKMPILSQNKRNFKRFYKRFKPN
nr:MAG TPA: hypothetical protein [Caudoviricetes sp.]